MSGIFGFINLDGRPADHEHFGAMAEVMARRGRNAVGSIISGTAAFGHVLRAVTHESRFEKMPYFDAKGGILFTTAARLDNRDELCDAFSIPLSERSMTPDGQLALYAYKKWEAESCRHLFGDWSFAAWQSKEQRLFLARDHLGNTGLFYYFKPPLFIFASDTEGILAHPEVPRQLDELRIAKNLGLSIEEQDWSRTYWKDIRLLPSAHTITLASGNKQIENYWRLDEAPSVRFPSSSDYLEGFLDHFRRAVGVRLNSVRSIGTQLSAGLDSCAVTALAAQELRKKNRPLVAYTSVPLHPAKKIFPNSLTDEGPLAQRVAKQYGNIEHISIKAADFTPLQAIQRSMEITQTPQHAASNMFWIISMFEHARGRNLGVMLTGQLGNGGVSWSGGRDYIFHFFVRNQWRKGLQALTARKKHQGDSWYRILKSHILRPMLMPVVIGYQRLLRPLKHTYPAYSFPQKEFIRKLGLKGSAGMISPSKRIDPLSERLLTTIRSGTMVGPIWHSFGSFYNMEVRDPTADVRLLEFCMGVPDELHTFEGGTRMLIRRSMEGILPDSIRWNTLRGAQGADATFRLLDQRPDVEMLLDRFQSSEKVTNYIDIASMKRVWNTMVSDWSSLSPSWTHALLRAINTAEFLLANAEEKTSRVNRAIKDTST